MSIKLVLGLALWAATITQCAAQPLTALARLDIAKSGVTDTWQGQTDLTLAMSLGVPFRMFTLADPPRLVLDFSELDFGDADPDDLLVNTQHVKDMRFGVLQPGWTRLVADLATPMLPDEVALTEDQAANGGVSLQVSLKPVLPERFVARSGAPASATWLAPRQIAVPSEASTPRSFTVLIDPGHGGIDPGAQRDDLVEKDLVLDFARQLRDLLRREGVRVVMTRDDDRFVSLQARTGLAHKVGATVFLSIHADALSGGGAQGATVYTLSETASDAASEQLAARHNRSDILAGVDLTGADDEVTSVLLDLARRETEPRSKALAQAVIAGMDAVGGPMNRTPWRQAGFSVLKSADIPSILLEIGFLSSARDRRNLADPVWRGVIAQGITDALMEWRDSDAARAALVRQ